MKLFIIKYALTDGITEVDGRISGISPNMVVWNDSAYGSTAHGKDWHKTREEAEKRAEQMRLKKIASLRAQILKLEKLSFSK